MKRYLRALLRRFGFEILHRTDDPVLTRMRAMHESLRLDPHNRVRWDDELPRLASDSHLRNLLELHQIDLALDIGANRGQFARSLRELGYQGDIISFEPLSRHQDELRRLAQHDGRWKVVQVALGNRKGEAQLHVYCDDTFSSLHEINRIGRTRFASLVLQTAIEHVPLRTLDSVLPGLVGDANRRILLKTDTQGHDLAVLAGASEVLSQTMVVLAEASLQPIYEGSATFTELVDSLRSMKFELSGMFPLSHQPHTLALIEVDAVFTRSAACPQG